MSLSATTDGSSLDSAVARQQKTVAATSRQADDSSRGSSRDTSIRDSKSNDCRKQLPHSVDASNRNYRDGKWEENGRSYNGGDSKHSETSSANQRFDQDISGGNDRWDNSANDRMRDNRRNDFAADVDRDRRDNSRNGRWIDTVNDRRDDREKFGGHSNKPYSGRASDTENVRDSRRNSNEFQNYNQRHRDDRPAYVAARIDDKKERRYENTKNLREENSITNVQKRNHSESSSQVENTYSLRESSGDRACLKSSESESAFPAIIQNEDSQQTSDYERDMELQSLGNNVAHDESDDEDLL